MGAAHFAVIAAEPAVGVTSPPGVESLAQYGVLGILCAAFAWFAYKAYQREAQRVDRLDAEVTRLNTVIQEQALPAVLAATEVMQDYTSLLRDQRHDQRHDQRPGARRDGYAPAAGHGDGDHR